MHLLNINQLFKVKKEVLKVSEIIEKKGINKIKDILLETNSINTFIKENDKTPIWDGEIYIYDFDLNRKKFKNDCFLGRIPVQVKGMSVKKFSNSIRVEKKYLKKFAQENGVIYYVVQFCNDEFKIYYNDFLNHKVKAILKDMHKNKSKDILFDEFPNDINKVYNIHKAFLENKKYQIIQNDDLQSIQDVLKVDSNPNFIFDLILPQNISLASIKKCILDQKPYLYYLNNGLRYPLLEQLGKNPEIIDLECRIDYTFCFESDFQPHTLEVIENETGLKGIIIDRIITIERDTGQISFTLPNDLTNVITILSTVEKILSAKKIKVNNNAHYISFFSQKHISESYQEIKDNLEFHKKLLDLLEFLNVRKKIDLSLMTEQGVKSIFYLYDWLILKKPSNLKTNKNYFFKFCICNITILLAAEYINNMLYLFDFFKCEKIKILFDEKQGYVSNYFVLISGYPISNGFQYVDNLNYQGMEKDILNGNKEKWYLNLLGDFALALIDKYDSNHDDENLNLAKKICEYLLKSEDSINTKLNDYQIKYRKNQLTNEEKASIVSIKNSSTNLSVQCGAALILNQFDDFEFYFLKLDKDEQEDFKKYPIYRLYLNYLKK